MQGVHHDLVSVVSRAIRISTVAFVVIEGLRSKERQKMLFDAGASNTLLSRHFTGHAIVLMGWVDNKMEWSWPIYYKIAAAMKAAAAELQIPIVWGGDCESVTGESGPEGHYFELDRKVYP
jgi:peptidoglycan L-alanyl-D-glutamate endopeptidase CwlK